LLTVGCLNQPGSDSLKIRLQVPGVQTEPATAVAEDSPIPRLTTVKHSWKRELIDGFPVSAYPSELRSSRSQVVQGVEFEKQKMKPPE